MDTAPPRSTGDSLPEELRGRKPWRDRVGLAIFAVGAIGAGIWLMVLGRGLTFFFDEWDWVDSSGASFLSTDLTPHNGHPVVVPFAIYRLTMALVGIRHYWPYLLLVVAVNVLCGWLLFVLLRRKVHPVIAAAAATVLMALGPAWQDLLWPFQIGFLGSMAGGLGALILLDRRRPRADGAALVCLLVAVFSSGIGVTMVAGITIELLWRRKDWRRIWVPLVPGAAFAFWELTKARGSSTIVTPGASAGVHFIGQSAAGAVGALVGRDTTVGSILGIALAVLIVVALINRPGQAGRLAMAIVGGLTFWLLTLVARGSDPTASRYLYPGAVFVLLAAGELPGLLRSRADDHSRHSGERRSVAVITGIVLPVVVVAYSGVAIWWNSTVLRAGQGGLLSTARTVDAELEGVQLAGATLRSSFQPDTTDMPQVEAGAYLASVAAYGSPADTPAELLRQSASVRTSVDSMLLRGLPMVLSSVPTGTQPIGDCPAVQTDQGLVVRLPAEGIWITAQTSTVNLSVAAFGPSYLPIRPGGVLPGHSVRLQWTGPTSTIPWNVLLQSSSPASVGCRPND